MAAEKKLLLFFIIFFDICIDKKQNRLYIITIRQEREPAQKAQRSGYRPQGKENE